MNTQYLKYAVEVANTGSITQAANNLYMAQPNISKAIKELEDMLGITIFTRTSKGVVPTRKGGEFLCYARNILSQIDRIETLSNDNEIDTPSINITVPRGSYILNGIIKFISELDRDKRINVDIKETNSMQAINDVLDERFNLGIVRYEAKYENYFLDYINEKKLCHELIWEFDYMLIISEKSSLASIEEISTDDLKGHIQICYGDSFIPYRNTGIQQVNDKNLYENNKIYVYDRGSQLDILSHIYDSYIFCSPLPDWITQQYGLIQRKCKGFYKKGRDILIYPKDYNFTDYDRKFIDKLYIAKNEVDFIRYQ